MTFAINHPINLIALIGLILDFWGVILLFKYGLPSDIEDTMFAIGDYKENKNEIERKNAFIRKKAKFGIGLVVVGFLIQLLSTCFHLSIDFLEK